MDATQLRIILLVVGLLLIAAIYFLGRPTKPAQGKRLHERRDGIDLAGQDAAFSSSEQQSLDRAIQAELKRLEETLAGDRPERSDEEFEQELRRAIVEPHSDSDAQTPGSATHSGVGARPAEQFDKVVSLIVAARAGTTLLGPDIVVAAEKAGLVFGDMNIFHRLADGRSDAGPIFSVANIVKPGNFDMRRISEVETPGVTFFMTLPGPISALDAWETMLPAAQRFAELLDAILLDDERNALGRQRIAFLRDELRVWDRAQERQAKRPW